MRINLSAGPVVLPEPVKARIASEWRNWKSFGCSAAEVSHRHPQYIALVEHTTASLRSLLNIPDDYHVLYMTGGGRAQYSAVPLNLLQDNSGIGAYLTTGHWSKLAKKMAAQFSQPVEMLPNETLPLLNLPALDDLPVPSSAAYLHYVSNETVDGVQLLKPPSAKVPLLADMSSDFLTRPIDVSAHGLIYACAQKNAGIAGVTIVIVHRDLVGHARGSTPPVLDYVSYVGNHSMPNTPPTFPIYVASCMFDWLLEAGGVEAAQDWANERARLLYQCIDQSALFENTLAQSVRSNINIVFDLTQPQLQEHFLKEAESAGIFGLKGHVARGGVRASLYNAIPIEWVKGLCTFMEHFDKAHAETS